MATRESMLAARERRLVRFNVRLESHIHSVRMNVRMGMRQRLMLAGQLLRDKVVLNISLPVVKIKKKRLIEDERYAPGERYKTQTYTVVDPKSRSKPGEFPRADTTRLMKDIFYEWHDEDQTVHVGTTLDYGLWLETRMQRSFLRRTFLEMSQALGLIIAGARPPLPGQDA